MLELSSLENQKILQTSKRISAEALLQNAVESKRAILEKNRLSLTTLPPARARVKGDRLLLNQALSNLIQNAIDFSPAGGEIILRSQIEGYLLKLIVEDHGSGIPDYAVNKVFNKFFSLQRPNAREKSTGLGLNVVAEVAKLHNGSVELENRQSGGVSATLSLPLPRPKISPSK